MTISSIFGNTDIMAVYLISYMQRSNATDIAFHNNPILWDSGLDEYQLAENEPCLWDKIASVLNSDQGNVFIIR